jgi:hypothetical protein
MKTNKALKRLTKIEALMSAVTERYSASAPHIREALDDAKAAVTRAKQAVSLQASSETAKQSKPSSKATPETSKRKRWVSEEGVKRIIAANKKRWKRVRAEAAKAQPAAKKSAPARKAKKSALAPAQAVMEVAAQ